MKIKLLVFLSSLLLCGVAGADTKSPIVRLPQTAKSLDIKLSPELAVKYLVNGYNLGQLGTMSYWIVGAHDSKALAQVDLQIKNSKSAFKLFINDLHIETRNDEATVTVQLGVRDIFFSTLIQTERLRLHRENNIWKIVPETPQEFFIDRDRGFLLNLATAIAHPEVMLSKQETATCLDRAKLVSLSWLSFQMEYEDEERVIGINSANFKDKLLPVLKNEQIFHCPADKSDQISFSFNGNLTGRAWSEFATPIPVDPLRYLTPIAIELFDTRHRAAWKFRNDKLVLFYEGSGNHLNFRHNGYAVVCLVDGHVQLVSEQQASRLMWKP